MTPRVRCPHCGAAHTPRQVLTACTVSWPKATDTIYEGKCLGDCGIEALRRRCREANEGATDCGECRWEKGVVIDLKR